MDPILIFYGAWTIEVVELVLGAGAPAVRLILDRAGASDGIYLNPPIGTLLEAAQFIEILERRQGMKIACPEEIAWRSGFIDRDTFQRCIEMTANSSYGRYLTRILDHRT